MGSKRWWRGPPIRVPVPQAVNCPGGQATMAQFLPVPATDRFVSVAGTVQSRFYETGKRTISFVSR